MTFSSVKWHAYSKAGLLISKWFCLNFSCKINSPTNQPTSQDGATSQKPIGLSVKGLSTPTELKQSVFQWLAKLPLPHSLPGDLLQVLPKTALSTPATKVVSGFVSPRRYMGLSFSWHYSPLTIILPCLLKLHILWWSKKSCSRQLWSSWGRPGYN